MKLVWAKFENQIGKDATVQQCNTIKTKKIIRQFVHWKSLFIWLVLLGAILRYQRVTRILLLTA